MKPATQALLILTAIALAASIGNACIADQKLTAHAQAALRWGALHGYAERLRHAWRQAQRDSTVCMVWAAVMAIAAAAVEFWP